MRMTRRQRPKARTMRPALGYLVSSQQRARSLGHNYVGTEHILLGLLERPDGTATIALKRAGVSPDEVRDRLLEKTPRCETRLDPDALATLGIDLNQVRAQVEAAFGPGSLELGPTRCMGISPRAKLALALAVDEAHAGPVNDDHVLIGLLSVEDSLATRVLADLGVSVKDLRTAISA